MEFWDRQTQYGLYRTRLFKNIFPDKDSFYTKYKDIGIGGFADDKTLNELYALLYARHANDAIFSSDEEQFCYKLFAIIYSYGGVYEKKLEILKRIRSLTDDEILEGNTSVYNSALNPSTAPGVDAFQPLKKINSQNANMVKRGKLQALEMWTDALDTGFIETFLGRFDNLFNPFPAEDPLIYSIQGGENHD